MIGCIDDGGLAGEVRSTYPKASQLSCSGSVVRKSKDSPVGRGEVDVVVRSDGKVASNPTWNLNRASPVVRPQGGVEGRYVSVSIAEVKHAFVVGKSGGCSIVCSKSTSPGKSKIINPQLSWSHTVSIVLDFVDVSVRGGYVDAPGRVNDCGRLDVGSRVEAPFSEPSATLTA